MDEILVGHLADLEENALLGIIDSSSAQSAYLGTFPADREAAAMSVILGVITIAAEAALLKRKSGVSV